MPSRDLHCRCPRRDLHSGSKKLPTNAHHVGSGKNRSTKFDVLVRVQSGVTVFKLVSISSVLQNGDPAEGIDSEDLVALSHVCIPSMHVSGMVAASYFARAAAWLTPLTLSFRTLSATPLESPDPERARTYLIVREARLQCSPFCTCLLLTRTHSVTFRTFMLHTYPWVRGRTCHPPL